MFRDTYLSDNTIPNIFSHCPPLVHISVDVRRRAGDDGGLPLLAQTAHRLHQEGQQWWLPGQSRCSLGSGRGNRASTETGNTLHIHTSFCWWRLVAVVTADLLYEMHKHPQRQKVLHRDWLKTDVFTMHVDAHRYTDSYSSEEKQRSTHGLSSELWCKARLAPLLLRNEAWQP